MAFIEQVEADQKRFESDQELLNKYQSKARTLLDENPDLAAMVRESCEPFIELVLRHWRAERAHTEAVGAAHG
jgi:hypothetical protein